MMAQIDRKIVVFFLLTLLCLPVLGTQAAQATPGGDDMDPHWSPDGKQISFTSNRDGNEEIYIMNADGSDTHDLTNSPNSDTQPIWSPDGQRILFTSTPPGSYMGDIMVINRADNSIKNLTADNSDVDNGPQWSPDGESILFSSMRSGQQDIYVMDGDGKNLRNISNGLSESGYYNYAWSPDGQHIAFSTQKKSTTLEELDVTDTRGDNLHRLLDQYWDNSGTCCIMRWAWSPDSQQIAFVMPNDGNIYGVDIATSHIRSLAYVGGSVTIVEWTHDSQRILYGVGDSEAYKKSRGAEGVYWVNLADGQIQQIAPPIYSYFYASPDQSQMLNIRPLQHSDGYSTDMTVYRLSDLGSQLIGTRFYNFYGSEWSPDSQKLAASLCVEGEGDADIYVFDPKTGQGQNLTRDDTYVGSQTFRSQCLGYG